jgi:hypothetical protein
MHMGLQLRAYGLLIMGHGRRQILRLGVTAHPTAEWRSNPCVYRKPYPR